MWHALDRFCKIHSITFFNQCCNQIIAFALHCLQQSALFLCLFCIFHNIKTSINSLQYTTLNNKKFIDCFAGRKGWKRDKINQEMVNRKITGQMIWPYWSFLARYEHTQNEQRLTVDLRAKKGPWKASVCVFELISETTALSGCQSEAV